MIGGVAGVYAALRLRGMPAAGRTARWAAIGLLIVLVIAIVLFSDSYAGFVIATLLGAGLVGLGARALVRRPSGAL
jgi:hypothetical protein